MQSHAPFLAAIAAQPLDPGPRLVYADWLDDAGLSERAELVRIEEEMRTLAVYSDRFWQLKARRNELRPLVSANWLLRLGYGVDVLPVFTHGWPDGWRERWRLIRELTERWHGITLCDVGGRQDEIAQTEARLGRTLPPSVREWVAYAHDVGRESGSSGLRFVFNHVYALGELEGRRGIALAEGSGYDGCLGVLHEERELTDPPLRVFRSTYEVAPFREVLVPVDGDPFWPALTDFVLCLPFREVGSSGSGFMASIAEPTLLAHDLEAVSDAITDVHGATVYESPNLLARIDWSLTIQGDTLLTVRATNAMTREQVPPLFWEYARQGYLFSGIFAPGVDADDDIPF